jgi:hypothetical protein
MQTRRRAGLAFATLLALTCVRCSLFISTDGLNGDPGQASPEGGDGATHLPDALADVTSLPDGGSDAPAGDGEVFPAGVTVWPENGHGYLLITQPAFLTWDEAKAAAEKRGGHLVTLTSPEENAFVFSYVRTVDAAYFTNAFAQSGPWLGASQAPGSAEPLGGWSWVTGEPWAYTAWAAMEPNNDPVTEAYLQFYTNRPDFTRAPVWNDVFLNGDVRAYIVELE